ncbi:MFS transporter [Psychromarinibacter halotolerans]|uniref:MFS transporter n=1 Tax=Psychromarinibacter halotolerans TaxID=1775175 RepID=A0ABV7GN21_9RHOB|nr:MFS transporter [Psychromarinibacter halotolerans]MDF0596608.1 MFS transporter [Psychromarinibacter halotolerans]
MRWTTVLFIMLGCHATSTLLLRLVPTIAPDMVTQYGWSPSFVGWLATAANLGSIVVVAGGVGLLRLLGSIKAVRWGLAAGGIGTLVLLLPIPALALVGSFIAGMGHGPTNPAGNDVLQRYVPRGKQALIFSVKQSSVPVAGVVGGLVLPGIAQLWGVEAVMVFGALVAVLTIVATGPVRRREPKPEPGAKLSDAMSRENLTAPVRLALSSPRMRSLALSGFLLAFVQSVWFVYLTSFLAFGLGYSATAAGVLYALMQGMSIIGRLTLGWGADRLGTALPLICLSLVMSTVSTLALAGTVLTGPGWPVVAVCLIGGVAAAGWNGIQVAETVRLAPRDRMYEAVSGITLAIGSGVVTGPMIVSALLGAGVDWGPILAAVALLPLVGVSATLRQARRVGRLEDAG